MSMTNKYICDCKAVTKTNLLNAIRKAGANNLLDIQNLTKASTGCGRCKSSVLQILEKETQTINLKNKQMRIDF
jgi:NAD(P)H-nitrite reductase large subunit